MRRPAFQRVKATKLWLIVIIDWSTLAKENSGPNLKNIGLDCNVKLTSIWSSGRMTQNCLKVVSVILPYSVISSICINLHAYSRHSNHSVAEPSHCRPSVKAILWLRLVVKLRLWLWAEQTNKEMWTNLTLAVRPLMAFAPWTRTI